MHTVEETAPVEQLQPIEEPVIPEPRRIRDELAIPAIQPPENDVLQQPMQDDLEE